MISTWNKIIPPEEQAGFAVGSAPQLLGAMVAAGVALLTGHSTSLVLVYALAGATLANVAIAVPIGFFGILDLIQRNELPALMQGAFKGAVFWLAGTGLILGMVLAH